MVLAVLIAVLPELFAIENMDMTQKKTITQKHIVKTQRIPFLVMLTNEENPELKTNTEKIENLSSIQLLATNALSGQSRQNHILAHTSLHSHQI